MPFFPLVESAATTGTPAPLQEEHNGEVHRFFGWAVYKVLCRYRKLLLNVSVGTVEGTEEAAELMVQYVGKMRILHLQAMTDEEYIKKYYPASLMVYNKGGLTLVSKAFFPAASAVMRFIREEFTEEEYKKSAGTLVRTCYDKLIKSTVLQEMFLTTEAGVSREEQLRVWKEIVTKTYHARIGVITKRHAESTTSHFAEKGVDSAFRKEMKAKGKAKMVENAKKLDASVRSLAGTEVATTADTGHD